MISAVCIDQKDIDAIVVATPDHTHAVAAVAALQSGRHLYCEKPLARTISEARIITETARKYKRVTQIGTQIHAGNNYRRVVELVQSGAIGPVREVHVWVNAIYGGHDAAERHAARSAAHSLRSLAGTGRISPVQPGIRPFKWRNWWAFGGGVAGRLRLSLHGFAALGAWICATPLSAEAVDGPPVHPDSTPPWLIVRYEFPARGAAACP